MVRLATLFCAILATAGLDTVCGHPGEPHIKRSLAHNEATKKFYDGAFRSLAACADSPHFRELQERTAARRLSKLAERRLDASSVLAKSHKSSLTGISPNTVTGSTLFGSMPQCILEPDVTEGPYYVSGELIRNDIREDQLGINLYTELQFIDVKTCKPVPNTYVDFWHCNTAGVYSGVKENGPAGNIDKTFHRGLYPTDADGLVQFTTKFPGHYGGRAVHIHILTNHNGEVLSNNTYVGSTVSSIGQIYFDANLYDQVRKVSPYTSNTQQFTSNAQDFIFGQSAGNNFDPIANYVLLGNTIEQGVFSWISIGIDPSISKPLSIATTLTDHGGVDNPNSSGLFTNPTFAPSRSPRPTTPSPIPTTTTPKPTTTTPKPTTTTPKPVTPGPTTVTPGPTPSGITGLACNYEGQLYAICRQSDRWSYENGRVCVGITRCVSQSAPYGVVVRG